MVEIHELTLIITKQSPKETSKYSRSSDSFFFHETMTQSCIFLEVAKDRYQTIDLKIPTKILP
jgi:hypothetical protein